MSYQSAKTKKRSGSAPGGRVRDPTGPSARGRPAARGRTPPFGPSARLYSSSEVGEAEDVERSEIDVSMHLVRRAAFSRLFDAPVAPVKLGSFTVLDRLGSGAMGTVYSAYDGQLDRKVAIKLLHRDETDRDRMLQEAQALARLSHPNVVAIFEVGTWERRPFMVMELIDGVTLATWLASARRSWRGVRDVLCDAARGLAAAHRVGLVHRDFKPANVLIDREGRVRVADFGLARPRATGPIVPPTLDDVLVPTSRSEAVTHSGSLAGTPAYMAPELFEGVAASDRSDQFAFCAVLYEALVGVRPFSGDTIPEIAKSVMDGTFRGWPRDCGVPGFLRRIVERGLARDPAARFASMDEVVALLQREPTRRVRAWALGLGVATVSAVATWSIIRSDEPCTDDGVAIERVWGSRKAALTERFGAEPARALAWARVVAELDAYADVWSVAWRDACEAARAGIDSDLLRVRRQACLDRRLDELSMLVQSLEASDPEVVTRAVTAAAGLPPLATCRDAELLLGQPDLPRDPEVTATIAALRLRVSEARALQALGKFDAGMAVIERAAASAREVDYPPLQAEIGLQRGALLCWTGQTREAEGVLQQAATLALAHDLPLVAADAWSYLVWARVYPEPRYGEAHAAADYAQALLEARPGQARRLATLRARRGRLYLMQGELDRTLAEQEAAYALRRRALGEDDPDTAFSLLEIGKVHKARGELAQAREHFEAAAERFASAIAPDHPQIAESLGEAANVMVLQGNAAGAVDTFARALALAVAGYGPGHDQVASLWSDQGLALVRLGRLDEAWDALDRAEAIWTNNHGPDGHPVVFALLGKGEVRQMQGAYAEAEALYRRALAIVERAEGENSRRMGTIGAKLGHLMVAQARWEDAVAHFEPALAITEAALGADHPGRASDLVGLATALVELGEHDRAAALVRDVLSANEVDALDPKIVAQARHLLDRTQSGLDASARRRSAR